jgi:hypothetical protein
MVIEKIFTQAFAIDENTKKNISIMQGVDYFHLKLFKEARLIGLREHLSSGDKLKLYISRKHSNSISENFRSMVDFDLIDDDFFSDSHSLDAEEKIRHLAGSVIIVNSHMPQWAGSVSTLRNFMNVYLKTENCLFVGWDWDNHHTVHISSIIAAGSDIYCHAHFNNDYEMACLTDRRSRVAVATFQWSEDMILSQMNYLMANKRINDPLGWHCRYGLFGHREKVVTHLSQSHSKIGLLEHSDSYFQRPKLERLQEWGNHKAHWVVPTLNDLPCRVFDALITGGIPIIPLFLKDDPELSGLDEQDCQFYSVNDIFDSRKLIHSVIEKFDRGGEVGIFRRINFAMEHSTFSKRLVQILKVIHEKLSLRSSLFTSRHDLFLR